MIEPAHVATELGRPTPAKGSAIYRQWIQWITDARMLISSGNGVHAGLGDLSALDQPTLDYVVRLAVAQHIRRPDNATQVQVEVDDGRVSRTYTSGRGRVSIDDEWWTMLAPGGQSSSTGAFSVRPGFVPDRAC